VEEKYQQFIADPNSVDESWREYFNGLDPAAQQTPANGTWGKVTEADARRAEKLLPTHGWDTPGQPGKGRSKLVRSTPAQASDRRRPGISHQFLWSGSCPIQIVTRIRN
jgi:2-oxoglutarate dehydrogenase complex dehydrogenase (E1) component-like enzyme